MHPAELYWQTMGVVGDLRGEGKGSVTCVVHASPTAVHGLLCARAGARFLKSEAVDAQNCARHFTFENGGYAIIDDVRPGVTECVVTLFESNPYV